MELQGIHRNERRLGGEVGVVPVEVVAGSLGGDFEVEGEVQSEGR